MSEGDNVSMGGLYFNKINPTYKGGLKQCPSGQIQFNSLRSSVKFVQCTWLKKRVKNQGNPSHSRRKDLED